MGNLTNCPKEFVIEAMLEFGKQLLELSAENAETKPYYNKNGIEVDKQSILNVINQIE